jgi:hypothetical protein
LCLSVYAEERRRGYIQGYRKELEAEIGIAIKL